MVVVIPLKLSCTPPPPQQQQFSTLSTTSSIDLHHHHSIRCDISFRSMDNHITMHGQRWPPCGGENNLTLPIANHADDDDVFSISLTNCQVDKCNIGNISTEQWRLNEDVMMEFNLSEMLSKKFDSCSSSAAVVTDTNYLSKSFTFISSLAFIVGATVLLRQNS